MLAEILAEIFDVTPEMAEQGRRLRANCGASAKYQPSQRGSAEHRARQSAGIRAAYARIQACERCKVRHLTQRAQEKCRSEIASSCKTIDLAPHRSKREKVKVVLRGGNFDSTGLLEMLAGES